MQTRVSFFRFIIIKVIMDSKYNCNSVSTLEYATIIRSVNILQRHGNRCSSEMSRYSSPRIAINEADLFIVFARVADSRMMNRFMASTISCDKTFVLHNYLGLDPRFPPPIIPDIFDRFKIALCLNCFGNNPECARKYQRHDFAKQRDMCDVMQAISRCDSNFF